MFDGLRFSVLLEQEPDGGYIASCPSLPGCLSQGETRQEALVNIAGAVGIALPWWERKWAIPLETRGLVEEERARVLAARAEERPQPLVELDRVEARNGPMGNYIVTVLVRGGRNALRRPVGHHVIFKPRLLAVITVPQVRHLRAGVVRALLRTVGVREDEITVLVSKAGTLHTTQHLPQGPGLAQS